VSEWASVLWTQTTWNVLGVRAGQRHREWENRDMETAQALQPLQGKHLYVQRVTRRGEKRFRAPTHTHHTHKHKHKHTSPRHISNKSKRFHIANLYCMQHHAMCSATPYCISVPSLLPYPLAATRILLLYCALCPCPRILCVTSVRYRRAAPRPGPAEVAGPAPGGAQATGERAGGADGRQTGMVLQYGSVMLRCCNSVPCFVVRCRTVPYRTAPHTAPRRGAPKREYNLSVIFLFWTAFATCV
jgi:hypothetical protein